MDADARLAGAAPPFYPAKSRGLAAEAAALDLGPFTDVVGTWEGETGWNLVAVPLMPPDPEKPSPPDDDRFTLLIQQYRERITFTPMVDTPNRSGTGATAFVKGVEYTLQIFELSDPSNTLHEENGMWLFLGDDDPPTIARQATVPHGDSVLAPGWYTSEDGRPQYPKIAVQPAIHGSMSRFGYLDPYHRNDSTEEQLVKDPCKLLADQLPDDVQRTISFNVDTAAYPQGGILNIPFIQKNADASRFRAHMWLVYAASGITLQYVSDTSLDFAHQPDKSGRLIRWPHIDLNTLTRASS
jgi:hypothetical protein